MTTFTGKAKKTLKKKSTAAEKPSTADDDDEEEEDGASADDDGESTATRNLVRSLLPPLDSMKYAEQIDLAIAQEDIDVNTLKTMEEDDLRDVFGLKLFGPRRRLKMRLDEYFGKAQASIPAAAPARTTYATHPPSAANLITSIAPPAATTTAVSAVPMLAQAAVDVDADADMAPAPAPVPAMPADPKGKAPMAPPFVNTAPAAPAQPHRPPSSNGIDDATLEANLSMHEKPLSVRTEEEVDDLLNAEAAAVGINTWVAKKVASALLDQPHYASKEIVQANLEEVKKLKKFTELSISSVVVCGATGAGKSTLLNAMLNEADALPTNGMRASTAAIVTLRHARGIPVDDPNPYEAVVDFISQDAWISELDGLLSELQTDEGRAYLTMDPERPQYASFCKLLAVYGETYTHSQVPTGEYRNGRAVYKPMMVPMLRAKLLRDQRVTRLLGQSKTLRAPTAGQLRRLVERYVDSSNEVQEGGAFWPIVKQVRMASAAWTNLKCGLELVDSPGVGDSDSARDKVVREYLRNADGVWIVSNIKRAVDDRIAKDLLGTTFRRMLFMDGMASAPGEGGASAGGLAFIATQTDEVLGSELAQNFGLSESTRAEAADRRNKYCKMRIQKDFLDGVAEVQAASGGVVDRDDIAKRFYLPVFTVSARDYQALRGLKRTAHGAGSSSSSASAAPVARLWSTEDETQIPNLMAHASESTLDRRAVHARRHAASVAGFLLQVHQMCQHSVDSAGAGKNAGAIVQNLRPQIRAAIVKKEMQLREMMNGASNRFHSKLSAKLNDSVLSALKRGASDGEASVSAIVRSWSKSPQNGGINWSTYKATFRRLGEWRINFNEMISEPIMSAAASGWEKVFASSLGEAIDSAKAEASSALNDHLKAVGDAANTIISAKLSEGVSEEVSNSVRGMLLGQDVSTSSAGGASSSSRFVIPANLMATLDEKIDGFKAHAQEAQREASRSAAPKIKSFCTPAYQTGYAFVGSGSHRRRADSFETFVDNNRTTMMKSCAGEVSGLVKTLAETVSKKLKNALADVQKGVRISYAQLCEEPDSKMLRARAQLARILNTPLCEARRALIDLLNAQGVDLASYQNVLGVAADRAGTSGAAPVVVDDDDDDDDDN